MYEQFGKQSVVKKMFGVVVVVACGLSLWLASPYAGEKSLVPVTCVQPVAAVEQHKPLEQSLPAPEVKPLVTSLPDFTYPAKVAIQAVVHIKASQNPKILKRESTHPLEEFFKEFFGQGFLMPKEYQRPAQEVFGSGVIYKNNGHIITNSHVVEGADQIEVTLNDKRSYKAKLVGADPVTDLAVLKIEATNLPVLVLGNSDEVEVGDNVLTAGNPFNLGSTVTSGIVSAKHRCLDASSNGKLGIQSFIQTDAAINPGSSGGALVNLRGELIGINTAIYTSRSASFIGYSFAIPSSLVKKVADDFIQYGAVQRVLLGVIIRDVNAELAKNLALKVVSGVYIDAVEENSPCAKELQKGDVITQINGHPINKSSELQEIIACAKPGDKVVLTLYRKGKLKTVEVVLKKRPDAVQVVKKEIR
ncbi:MAG: trypsin-like peptidase domain-containing protein [Candidatus Cardinium sp.]|nr:trypsin-like peptidase domain-containing protein [Candidatus Cardinium sp.]